MVDVKDSYKVSQIADFFGLSSDTIRFYDKMEILCPKKNKDTNYRTYTWSDLISMDYIFRLKKIDLPLSEIKLLVNDYSIEESLEAMKVQEAEIERKIEELSHARRMAKEYISVFEEIERMDGKVEIKKSPAIICREIDHEENSIMEDFQKLTNTQMPCLTFVTDSRNIEVSKDARYTTYKENIRNQADHYISILDDGALSQSRLVTENKKIKICPAKFCVHAVKNIKAGEELKFLRELVEYAEKEGYRVYGNIFVRLLALSNSNGTEVTSYELWLPIKDDPTL